MRLVVVGHCEWIEFLRVERMPAAGDIVHTIESWAEPGGGGPAAAAQLAQLGGGCALLTALGDDELGARMREGIEARRVQVAAAMRAEPTRRGVTHIDAEGERTITVIGQRLEPRGADALPWHLLDNADGAYFVSGDAEAARHARRARVLVATARALPALKAAAVPLDALVGSANDAGERYDGDLSPEPQLVVRTDGDLGGTYTITGHDPQRYAAAPLPGPESDRYGAGDAFAAALTFALAAQRAPAEAVDFAAECAAAVVTGRGPYEGQLPLAQTSMR